MIPEHLIDQAWHAYVRSSNQQAIRNEMAYPDLRGPMPPPPDPRLSMRAALEAAAADIWDQGHVCGYSDAQDTARGIRLGAHNPYKRNENA